MGRLHVSLTSRPGVLNLSLTMYPFSISTYEHVPRKFLMTKYFIISITDVFNNKHITAF